MILHLHVQNGDRVLRFSTSLRAESAASAEPRWCQLFPVGIVRHRGDFGADGIDFTREFLAAMVANWEKVGRPHQHVNYDHRDGIAAGWIEGLELRDDGLYALIRWTAKARSHIAADEYRFLSPEFSTDGLDKATGKSQGPTLYGCALLNDPYLEELPRVAAANHPNAAKAAETNMNWKTKLLAVLALAATATDTDIEKGLDELKENADKATKADADAKKLTTELADATAKLDLATRAGGDVVQLRTALTETATHLKAATEKVTALEATNAALVAEKKTSEIDGYLNDRVKAGVLTPAMVPGVKALALSAGLPTVKAIYDVAPVVVKLGESGVTGDPNGLTPATALVKFNAAIDAVVTERKVKRSDARDIATRENPDLAKLAAKA